MLSNIGSRLLAIEDGIKAIIKGQQDDRVALMYSGRELLRQADAVFNLELKTRLQAIGIANIEECRQKIFKEIEALMSCFTAVQTKKSRLDKLKDLIDPLDSEKDKKAEEFMKQSERLISCSVLIYSYYYQQREFHAARESLITFRAFTERLKTIGKTIERHLPFNQEVPADDLLEKQIPDLLQQLHDSTPIMLGVGSETYEKM